MKASKVVHFFIPTTIIIIGILIYQNETKSIWELMETTEVRVDQLNSFYKDAENLRIENRIKFLSIGSIVIIILIIISKFFIKKEKKNDPIANLKNLRKQNIINEEEYNSKLIKENELRKKLKEEIENRKKIEKITLELKNLKEKGILSEIEYNEKINLINKTKL